MSFCNWDRNPEQEEYHNKIWGRPLHEDAKHFEFISYEVFQCGLSWWTVYNKRDFFRKAFDEFNVIKIANYTEEDINRIMNSEGIIKSESKIRAVINNAKCFLKIVDDYGSFDSFLWGFTEDKTIIYDKHNKGYIPASNGLSNKISIILKKYGFKFLGPVVIYSHLQAAGLILDHDSNCPCYKEIVESNPVIKKRRHLEKNIHHYE